MNMLDAPDEDFTVLDDNKTINLGITSGGIIEHTRDAPDFVQLNTVDKVNYGAFMVKYDVNEKQEFAQGVELGKSGKNIIDKVFKEGDAFAAVNRINITITMTAFGIIVVLFVIVFFIKFFNFITGVLFNIEFMNNLKAIRCWELFKYTVCLSLITLLMKWFYDRTTKRITIIQYFLK